MHFHESKTFPGHGEVTAVQGLSWGTTYFCWDTTGSGLVKGSGEMVMFNVFPILINGS